ncbi:hypothetical protein F5144DRAFT_558942 [Chaetomium tenue]|uniref:Uncharacterized protein n=1 Tax=Chaetomium tenue TaxID=1854479 RepID=A0ACB7PS33_9PEZI|nr:hypothetical protein F5144DRAFT_558942 [Chaetomium globosum]
MSEELSVQETGADETDTTDFYPEAPWQGSPDKDQFGFGGGVTVEDRDAGSDSASKAAMEAHDEIMSRLRDDDINLATFDQRQEFLRRYEPYLNPSKRRRGDPTILHKIAMNCKTEKAAALVRLLVKEHPDLMEAQDESDRTPMHVAILHRRSRLVTAMAEAVEDLDRFLGIQDGYGCNCLHAALKAKLPHQIVVNLVRRASEKSLYNQDRHGLTPLHIAVSYDMCSASQLEVVRELVTRGASALSILTGPPHGLSPYQHHVFTREKLIETRVKNPKMPVEKQPKKKDLSHKIIVTTETADQIERELKLGILRTMTEEQAKRMLYGHNPDDIQISFDYDRLPRKMVWNEFVQRFGKDARSGLRFDRVLQLVTFPRVEVILKGRQADLERDAEPRSGPLGRRDMQYFFNWLYEKGVRHIIRLSVDESAEPGERVHSDQAIQESLERFIVEHLDWKKMDLDPETILRISSKVEKKVPTPEDPTKFNTEIVSDRQLRQLYLRWSGSNAVLRGWSEPGSLAMLPHIKEIVLFAPPTHKTYDSPQWIASKVRDFQARLNVSRQAPRARVRAQEQLKLELGTSDMSNGLDYIGVMVSDSDTDVPPLATEADATLTNSHRWLDSTARFAAGMTPFWGTTVKDFLASTQYRPTSERLENDIVLALIDDGVDMFGTPHTGQILEGKSFDFHEGKAKPSFLSATGHGTVLASMILRVCPMVKVYPIRLKMYEKRNTRAIDAGYAAQAIQAALDKKATIICMAWTIPITQGQREEMQPLHKVLHTAVERNVLMFCSAYDGVFTGAHYPSGPWSDRFFRIGAASLDGTVFDWSAEDGITYIIPGVDVTREQPLDTASGGDQGIPDSRVQVQATGSSIATALAAGLAAMIIYCIKASILAAKTANDSTGLLLGIPPDSAVELIAQPDEMKRAFASLGKVTPKKFVQVWEKLDKISEVLEASRTPNSTPEVKEKSVRAFVDFGLELWNSAVLAERLK